MTRYVVVGDSQAEGLGMNVALPSVLGDRLVRVHDHRGFSTARLLNEGPLATAAGDAAEHDATLLIFAGGNDNDVLESSTSRERYKQTLLAAVKAVARKSANAGKHINVVWFGPVFARERWNALQHPQAQQVQASVLRSSAVRTAIAEVPGASVSVRWVDSFPLTRDLAREENVHLTADGYRTYADRAVRAVEGGSIFGVALAAGAAYAGWRWWKGRQR